MSNIDLYSCDAYLINLDKDIGRKMSSRKISALFKAKTWSGTDPNIIDNDGYVIKWKTPDVYTRAAKMAKHDLFKHFLTSSSSKYLLVLEDDIYIHKDMFDQSIKNSVISKINNVLKFKDPAILYLGLSRHVVSKEDNINNFFVEPISKSFQGGKVKICCGAYGFIVNRNVIQILMARITNATFKNDPFDLSCLGYLITSQTNRVYVSHPPIIVPDITASNIRDEMNQDLVWDILNIKRDSYEVLPIGLCFVTATNELDFNYFKKMITMITPYVKVIYIASPENIIMPDEKLPPLLNSENEFDIGDSKYIFIMRTTTECRLQYKSASYLLNLIGKYTKSCKILNIINGETKEIMIEITYCDAECDNTMTIDWKYSDK